MSEKIIKWYENKRHLYESWPRWSQHWPPPLDSSKGGGCPRSIFSLRLCSEVYSGIYRSTTIEKGASYTKVRLIVLKIWYVILCRKVCNANVNKKVWFTSKAVINAQSYNGNMPRLSIGVLLESAFLQWYAAIFYLLIAFLAQSAFYTLKIISH